jgi:hypothetical protein
MAYIETIPPRAAKGELRDAYLQIRRDMVGRRPVFLGMAVWNIMQVFSLRPAFLMAFERAFLFTMWGGVLRREAKERSASRFHVRTTATTECMLTSCSCRLQECHPGSQGRWNTNSTRQS